VRPVLWLGALGSVLAAAVLYRAGGFSTHMAAHLLLSLVTPPLLLAGLRWTPPVPAWLGFLALNAVTVGVHLPSVNRVLMASPALHVLEGLAFVGSGLLFWSAARRGGWAPIGLLAAQMAACALLGAAITFSRGVYVGPADDVALGGVLMWVAGGAVYMGWGLLLFMRALHLPERTPPEPSRLSAEAS